MSNDFAAAMRRAAGLTCASNVTAATRVIQTALLGRTGPLQGNPSSSAPSFEQDHPGRPPLCVVRTETATADIGQQQSRSAPREPAGSMPASDLRPSRLRKPLGEVLQSMRNGRLTIGALGPGVGPTGLPGTRQPPPIPDGAQFLSRSFTCAAGTRTYKLYIPASAPDHVLGLVVMLHGCKQNPDDFAVGTNMNAMAETRGLAVAYPAQSGASNAALCWNWFNPPDQLRGAGEPSIIEGLTREIVSELNIDPNMVFVAGLSAGGAMAAVMGATYPELYAAVGVHSGLAFQSAHDVMSAFAAMRGEVPPGRSTGAAPPQRTIVFHGSADRTVHPSNGTSIFEGAARHHIGATVRRQRGCSPGGRSYTRSTLIGQDGTPLVECWLVEGGHAWSGGGAQGSYTDPLGPDATAEMVRFFLEG